MTSYYKSHRRRMNESWNPYIPYTTRILDEINGTAQSQWRQMMMSSCHVIIHYFMSFQQVEHGNTVQVLCIMYKYKISVQFSTVRRIGWGMGYHNIIIIYFTYLYVESTWCVVWYNFEQHALLACGSQIVASFWISLSLCLSLWSKNRQLVDWGTIIYIRNLKFALVLFAHVTRTFHNIMFYCRSSKTSV